MHTVLKFIVASWIAGSTFYCLAAEAATPRQEEFAETYSPKEKEEISP